MPATCENQGWNWTLEVYLMPLFPVCLHVRMLTALSLQYRAVGSRWISLTSEQHSEPCICLFIGCTFVSMFAGPHMCTHLGYCVKPSVVNPLICWTLEITAVICQLCQRGLEGACTSLHTHTNTRYLISTSPVWFQSNKILAPLDELDKKLY